MFGVGSIFSIATPVIFFNAKRIGMRVDRAPDEQVAADLTPCRIGEGFVDAQLVQARAAFEMEIMQQVEDDVARRRDEILVPAQSVAVDGHRAAAMGKEARCQSDILHHLEWRVRNVRGTDHVAIQSVRPIVQHRYAIADQFDMPEFLRSDGGDETVERPQLAFRPEIETLEQVVPERGHLAVFSAKQFLESGGGIWILRQGGRKFDLKFVDTEKHWRVLSELRHP